MRSGFPVLAARVDSLLRFYGSGVLRTSGDAEADHRTKARLAGSLRRPVPPARDSAAHMALGLEHMS